MNELRPCPFCGGRAVDLHATYYGGGERRNKPRVAFYVRCGACGARGPMFKARGEGFSPISERDHDRQRARALDAWNRRAERTCRMGAPIDGEYRCSECGYLQKETYRHDKGWDKPRYCSHCGAKVVSDD